MDLDKEVLSDEWSVRNETGEEVNNLAIRALGRLLIGAHRHIELTYGPLEPGESATFPAQLGWGHTNDPPRIHLTWNSTREPDRVQTFLMGFPH